MAGGPIDRGGLDTLCLVLGRNDFQTRNDTQWPESRNHVLGPPRWVSGRGDFSVAVKRKKIGTLTAALSHLGDTVALDVETDGIKPTECGLLCVGLSDGVRTVVIWPWKPKFARPLYRWLCTRTAVVCHNGGFDILVLEAHGVKA